ncbi:MAG: NAD-dependent succinate-semialdehyde dehydrogenase [Alphaproteobacteria bacterium]|nr:NAD-dependent succinate-semialdehyde dehydrogenase [Alphaproteobacteria bacterium]
MTYPSLALFIDGSFRPNATNFSDVINPATGEAIAQLPHAGAAELDEALTAADRAFPGWSRTSAYERGAILRRGAQLMRDRVEEIARILVVEQGKTLAEAKGELLYSADTLDWYAEEGRRAYGRTIPSRTAGMSHVVVPEPVGPCASFTPWNFPALTPARKIGGALAAGCTLILKAAEETPGTAVEMVRALHDAGLPAGVLNLVFGVPSEVSTHLIGSPLIRKVSFTGSTVVGKHLARLAAEHMQRTTLELGGHAPVLVCGDVDPEKVADVAAAGKYRNAGQVCISPTRFYVHESIIDRFTDRFASQAQALKLGDGLDPETRMGPLANERRLSAMEALVSDARDRGGKILTGGKRNGNRGFFFEPTVITDVDASAMVMTTEPFGPMAPIVPFRDLDEVLDRANSLPYGLASYAFTHNSSNAAAIAGGLKAGMVGINTLAVSHPETPFGGVRDSGVGSEGGIEGLQAYFDTKAISHIA